MKVKTRLSLYCSLIFGVIFAIVSVSVYGLYHRHAEKAVYTNLKQTALIAAWFYLEEDELSEREFEKIRQQFEEIATEEYQVYDLNNQIVFGHKTQLVSPALLERIRQVEQLHFKTEEYICYGMFYRDNQGDFVVVTKDIKNVLESQLQLLLWILIPAFLLGIVAIILLSRWVAQFAYRPFTDVIRQVNNISTNNLDVQIQSPNTEDELQELIDTFNDLLEKISGTFIMQKNFVRYVSHEFKTPLASLLGNVDLFTTRDYTPGEYRQLAGKLTRQILHMEKILETLIIVSDLKKESDGEMHTRIDELIWEIIEKIKDIYPQAKLRVQLEITPEQETLLSVDKDPTQLWIALFNLIDNAIKYSRGEAVTIELKAKDDQLCLSVTDQGIGIPADQMEQISKPFSRADNAGGVQGSGIGLSLALRIFSRNEIHYNIHSEINKGTKIMIVFNQG